MQANGIDVEAVLGQDVQNTPGSVEEFEGLVIGVGNCCGDLQVLRFINRDVGDWCPDGQAGATETVTAEITRATRETRR